MATTIHLLALRGGTACGAMDGEATPEANDVTCQSCIDEHNKYLMRYYDGTCEPEDDE